MDLNNWKEDEVKIVKELCRLQFESFKRLYYEENHEEMLKWVKNLMIENDFDDDDMHTYKRYLLKRARKYKHINKYPHKVYQVDEQEMSQLKHALTQFEEDFKEKNPDAVKRVWEKFFFYDHLKNFSNN